MLDSILDYVNQLTLTNTVKRPLNVAADKSFSNWQNKFPDLWKIAISSPENAVCCPVSSSLGEPLSRNLLLSHILIADVMPGEFKTLKNQKVSLHGSELVCSEGTGTSRLPNSLQI